MNAPLQRHLFTKRWAKVPKTDPLEADIQKALVQRLNLQARKDVLWWHVPNGEYRTDATGARLKAMGVLPGVADLMFIIPELVSAPTLMVMPRVLFLELKRKGGKLSPEQVAFAARARRTGASYEVADSIDAAVAILERYGILPAGRYR